MVCEDRGECPRNSSLVGRFPFFVPEGLCCGLSSLFDVCVVGEPFDVEVEASARLPSGRTIPARVSAPFPAQKVRVAASY